MALSANVPKVYNFFTQLWARLNFLYSQRQITAAESQVLN